MPSGADRPSDRGNILLQYLSDWIETSKACKGRDDDYLVTIDFRTVVRKKHVEIDRYMGLGREWAHFDTY